MSSCCWEWGTESEGPSKEPVLIIESESGGKQKQVNHTERSMYHLDILSLYYLVLKGFQSTNKRALQFSQK